MGVQKESVRLILNINHIQQGPLAATQPPTLITLTTKFTYVYATAENFATVYLKELGAALICTKTETKLDLCMMNYFQSEMDIIICVTELHIRYIRTAQPK